LEIVGPHQAGIRERPDPQPGPGEVLIRVEVAGFGDADLEIFLGQREQQAYPRVPSREIAGVVEAAGPGVDGWPQGAPALVFPHVNCGRCHACRSGRATACGNVATMGVDGDGGMCEFVVAPADHLLTSALLLPAELALVEPLATGFHAIDRARVIGHDTVVAIHGCDVAGLGAVAAAAARGACVLAADPDEARLDLARAAGARRTVRAELPELASALRDAADGEGPDVVIDALGHDGSLEGCIEAACCAGRVVCLREGAAVLRNLGRLRAGELDVLGSARPGMDDLRSAVAHLESRTFPVNAVIGHTVPLAAAAEALTQWAARPARMLKVQVALP
jgi:threonine dehydrogenase-like Zn-dependent dehydrogenase